MPLGTVFAETVTYKQTILNHSEKLNITHKQNNTFHKNVEVKFPLTQQFSNNIKTKWRVSYEL